MDDLLSSGHAFSLFEAVALIDDIATDTRNGESPASEHAHTRRFDAAAADAPGPSPTSLHRAGAYLPPSKEHVRFRAVRHMGFPAADIARISLEKVPSATPGQFSARYVIEATCLGLYGPDSPLPSYVNERIVAHDRDATALRDFLDLFNHRMLILLCRIARRYRHIRVFDPAATDEISLLAGALIGERDPGTPPPDDEARSHRLRNVTPSRPVRHVRAHSRSDPLRPVHRDRGASRGVRPSYCLHPRRAAKPPRSARERAGPDGIARRPHGEQDEQDPRVAGRRRFRSARRIPCPAASRDAFSIRCCVACCLLLSTTT